MKKFLLSALAILLALAVAVPATAQNYRSRSHRRSRSSEFERGINRIGDVVTAPIRVLGQRLCDNHRGSGDAMEASWCYGEVYDSAGRFSGYNPNSVHGQMRRGYYRDRGFRFNRGNSRRDQVVATQPPQYDEREREVYAPDQEQTSGEIRLFRNCTQGRIFLGNPETGEGFYLNPGERGNAAASSPAYGKFSGNFAPATIMWQGNMALITAPEGD